MAFAAKRRVVVNAGRRRRKRNARKLSAKQIRFFGTPAQKAALKNSRKRKRNAAARTHVRRATKRVSRVSHRRRTRAQKNPGDILSLTLNPARGKSMARRKRRSTSRRHSRRRSAVANPRRRRYYAARHNPHRRRRNYTRHRRRTRNAPSRGMGMSLKSGVMFTVGAGVGFFGSKLLSQTILGSGNTGVTGYLTNALTTAGLAVAAHMFKGVLGPSAGVAVLSGGLLQLIARVLTDQTPFGQFTSSLGVGDYQMQNFVTPQRLVDPLNSAQIEIPQGWGSPPPVAIQTAAAPGAPAPGGMHGYNVLGYGNSMYSSRGLYS
jgi:hypothetical protein